MKRIFAIIIRIIGWMVLGIFAVVLIRSIFPSSIQTNRLWPYIAAAVWGVLWAVSLITYQGGMRAALRLLRGWRVLLPIFSLIALVTLSIFLSKKEFSAIEPLSSPGVVFILGMAVLTILGFLVTIAKLDEIHSRIYDYSFLIERCEKLVDNELNRVQEKKKSRVIIFANAPAFGNMSVPEQYSSFREKLVTLLQNEHVEVVLACLSWKPRDGTSPHNNFYMRHWPPAQHREVSSRIAESESLINHVCATALVPEIAPKMTYCLKEEIKEVPFHLFMTTDAAVLFVSLWYPPEFQQTQGSRLQESKVQIMGFETTDRAALLELERGFRSRIADPDYAELETHSPAQLDVQASLANQDSAPLGGEE
jgi:hypothetical protein